ncbi:hypothetical protein GCM10011509_10330 [Ornithinimicrobium pekingense]|uniref:Uncharacterized protein n=1 Tax=Ornithinimicrobium pekingense TaxID=384677 RepID=A0ABQ2F9C4_9MICO|nr:hypothetical protein GCM10011509_10330 [Ornithinimicrobium pekingense]
MWVHTMSLTATWWMWTLMLLATVGFWTLVAVVVKVVVTRPGPGERTAPISSGTTSCPGDAAPAHHEAGASPPPLPLPDQAETSPGRRISPDVGTGRRGMD